MISGVILGMLFGSLVGLLGGMVWGFEVASREAHWYYNLKDGED